MFSVEVSQTLTVHSHRGFVLIDAMYMSEEAIASTGFDGWAPVAWAVDL